MCPLSNHETLCKTLSQTHKNLQQEHNLESTQCINFHVSKYGNQKNIENFRYIRCKLSHNLVHIWNKVVDTLRNNQYNCSEDLNKNLFFGLIAPNSY